MLTTAILYVGDGGARRERVRALLDPCSEASLSRLDLVRRLGDHLEAVHLGVAGVAGPAADYARLRATVYLHDPTTGRPWTITVYALRSLGIASPPAPCSAAVDTAGLHLADPEFQRPRGVDLVLGADVYSRVLLPDIRRLGGLLAQNTIFGWTLTGTVSRSSDQHLPLSIACCATSTTPEDDYCHERRVGLLQRFWALEDVLSRPRRSRAEEECEQIYRQGVRRDALGRYIVPLPIKDGALTLLGESLLVARRTLQWTH